MIQRVAIVLPILLVTACGGSADRTATSHEVVDSAGIQLVLNAGSDSIAVLQPDLIIGTLDGPEELQFFRITAMAVDESGRIFVGDGSSTIREFDASGDFVRRFGQRGDGPGEFQWPGRIFRSGDTTAVSDSRLYRLTMFDDTGALIGTAPFRHGSTITHPIARVPGGWIMQPWEFAWRDEVGKARRDTLPLMFASNAQLAANEALDEAALRPVASYQTGRSYGIPYEMNGRAGMTANSPLWEPSPGYAVDAAGNVYVSSGGPYRIDVYDVDGVHWRSIMRDHDPVPTTGELNDRYWNKVNTWLDTTTNTGGEWNITVAANRGRADLPVNEALPALGQLIVSDEGMLWAYRPDLAEDPLLLEWTREGTRQDTNWDVFDHEGRFIVTVRFPAGFRARAAADRSIYGVLRDEMDVEHMARFTLPGAT